MKIDGKCTQKAFNRYYRGVEIGGRLRLGPWTFRSSGRYVWRWPPLTLRMVTDRCCPGALRLAPVAPRTIASSRYALVLGDIETLR